MIEQQYFPSSRNQKKQLSNFHKIVLVSYKMETQKIINLLNDAKKNLDVLQKSGMPQTGKKQR